MYASMYPTHSSELTGSLAHPYPRPHPPTGLLPCYGISRPNRGPGSYLDLWRNSSDGLKHTEELFIQRRLHVPRWAQLHVREKRHPNHSERQALQQQFDALTQQLSALHDLGPGGIAVGHRAGRLQVVEVIADVSGDGHVAQIVGADVDVHVGHVVQGGEGLQGGESLRVITHHRVLA